MTLSNSERRTELAKGVLAGGMVAVGFAAGDEQFFNVLVDTSINMGGSLLANMVEKTVDDSKRRWISSEGALDSHVGRALSQAFDASIDELEAAWKKHPQYNYLLRSGERERAKLSIELLRELRDSADSIFGDQESLTALLRSEGLLGPSRQPELFERAADERLRQALDNYLSVVEPLAELAKRQLPHAWLINFGRILESPNGTGAWRVCQRWWMTSLSAATEQLRQSQDETRNSVASLDENVAEIKDWLSEWRQRIEATPVLERDFTAQEVMHKEVLMPHTLRLQEVMEDIKSDTEAILRLLQSKFIELDFNDVMFEFLQKELLNDHYVNLGQAGHDAETEPVSLAHVFVDLMASSEFSAEPVENDPITEAQHGMIAEIVRASEQPLDFESLRLVNGRHRDSNSWLRYSEPRPGRYVLIGGPGQGKTTISQFTCQLFRAAILGTRPENVRYDKVLRALQEIQDSCDQENIALPTVPRIPFRIALNNFAAELAPEGSPDVNSLLSCIAERIKRRTDRDVTTDHLRGWLAQYPWLIVLDGLDEVPPSSNRSEVLSAVDSFWIDAESNNADVLVVATTRPQGYGEEFSPNDYHHKWLSPLSRKRASHYANRLVSLRYGEDKDRQGRVLNRLESALKDESTARLMRSPLQVTIMTALVDRIGKPPQERYSLFQRYYDVIYSREMERNIPAATILRDYRPDINAIHYRVGLLLQMESEYTGQTGARLPLDRFANVVEARLSEEGHEGEELHDLQSSIMEAATTRLVFLVEVEAEEVGFEVRSLQEFMAAEALMQGGDDLVHKRLRRIGPIINWRNVFLFAAGKCFAREDLQHLRDSVRGVCQDLNESGQAQDEASRVTLAGSQLALDLLEDGPARRQPLYARALARLALRLLDLPPDGYHNRLATLYDPRLHRIYQEEFESRLQNTNPVLRLGAWAALIRLYDVDDVPIWVNDLIERYWPNSENEQALLYKVASEAGRLTFVISRIGERFAQLLSTYQAYRLLMDDPSFRRQELLETMPRWLRALRQGTIESWDAVPLKRTDGEQVAEAMRVSFLFEGRSDWLEPFAGLSSSRPDWFLLTAASRFAKDPCKRTLARTIMHISRHFPLLSDTGWMLPLLPWPMSSILHPQSSAEDLARVADEVARGEYGDTGDWQAAEQRWLTQGVGEDDLSYTARLSKPFDNNIGRFGFPLNRYSLSGVYVSTATHSVRLGLDLFSEHGASELGSVLADWILSSLTIGAIERRHPAPHGYDDTDDKSELPKLIEFDQFETVMSKVPKNSRLPFNVLEVVDWSKAGDEERVRFLQSVGQERNVYAISSAQSATLMNDLSGLFTSDSARTGILTILAAAVQAGSSHTVPPVLLDPSRFNEAKYRRAAIVARLPQITEHEDLTFLVEQTTAFGEHELSDFVEAISRTVQRHELTGLAIEKFLAQVYEALSETSWESRKELVQTMNDSSRRRTSRLVDDWDGLGLPKNLPDLLRI